MPLLGFVSWDDSEPGLAVAGSAVELVQSEFEPPSATNACYGVRGSTAYLRPYM